MNTNIIPDSNVRSHKTGRLVNINAYTISRVLGFEPNVADDPDKVENSWGFTIDGKPFNIWDYYGSHEYGMFSCFGPHDVLRALFPKNYQEM
jgi:hypothetical protein